MPPMAGGCPTAFVRINMIHDLSLVKEKCVAL
uniref:Uncharacterized protein n=1 Tax=Magnetospirillum gryphiswaldense TaxID=55518 RepID=A4TXW4_9PROT|nr:hypothetical protein MGR_3470 [Magnetospirillum gryphiswaldense MSR-1]